METSKKAREKPTIMQIGVDSTDMDGVLSFVAGKLSLRRKFFITTPNPEIIVAAQGDPHFLQVLNKADLSLPDGAGVLWANKWLGNSSITRLPGRKVMLELLHIANQEKLKVFFMGSTDKVIKKTLQKIKEEYPNITAKGDSGPLLDDSAKVVTDRDLDKEKVAISEINKFKPDLLFVAFGAPKQEKWIANNLDNLLIGGAMTVGGSLDTFSGALRPVPEWMSQIGLEWVWRLIQQPNRAGRIFTALIVFPLMVLTAKARR